MQRSDLINELAAALSAAQGKMEAAAKDSANPYYRSTYADLASCWSSIRAPLSEHGLAVLQPVSIEASADGIRVSVETVLAHASGQWVSGVASWVPMRQSKDGGAKAEWVPAQDPQAVGSCITYARRYALCAMVGVAPEDDDANAASGVQYRPEEPQKHRAPPAKPASAAKKNWAEMTPDERFVAGHARIKAATGDVAKLVDIGHNLPEADFGAEQFKQLCAYCAELASAAEAANQPVPSPEDIEI